MLIFRLVIQMTTITFIVKHILYMYIHRDTQNISWNIKVVLSVLL